MPINIQEASRQARVMRRPQHRFQIRQRAWQIQPFFIAPVLPGETMRSLLVQARVVSDPIQNPLIGWWYEQYYFYVKHRDLSGREDFTEMMLDINKDMSSYAQATAADVPLYTFLGGTTWASACLERVTEEYFRDEGEAWNGFNIDGLPAASISLESFLQSAVNESELEVAGADLAVDLDSDTTITASEVESALRQWQMLRHAGVTEMSYEDFLRSYGVRAPETLDPHRPELVRYIRDWTYPTNTVDPTDGTPSTALSWSVAERADKDRFFPEPGFLFGVSVCRPKVYLSPQTGSGVGMMDSALSWLPAVLSYDPAHSLKHFDAGSGPLPGNTDGYWIDVRDLLIYGDQYVNFALTETNAGLVALPTAALQKRYATESMAESLFVDSADAAGLTRVRSDGVVSLQIAGTQRDHTP